MPNWCDNTIKITGTDDKIAKLWNTAFPSHGTMSEDGGLLESMVPLGEWQYDTAVEAWGTKWDINDEGLEFLDNEDGTATIHGWASSAWSPPIEAFKTYQDKNTDVTITCDYWEPGMDFIGSYNNGEENYYDNCMDLVEQGAEKKDPELNRLFEDFGVREQYAEILEDESEETVEEDGSE